MNAQHISLTRKILLFLLVLLIFSNTLSASACWPAPEPFEIFSEDGTRVFVFSPEESGAGNAYAAVYTINPDSDRQLLYTVEDLSSFAYKSNFLFSSDMMHFVRMFNPSGLPIFEIFSNGVRSRTVYRSDIIENYAAGSAVGSSIGPTYTVGWSIQDFSPQDAMLTIRTEEGKLLLLDLARAEFIAESVAPDVHETSPNLLAYSPIAPTPVTNNSIPTLFFVLFPLAAVSFIFIFVLLQRRNKKT